MMIENKTILKNMKKNVMMSFLGAILIMIFAIVLLKNPENFLSVAVTIFGYFSLFLGVLSIGFYFRIPEEERIYHKKLMTGILLISFGLVSFFENSLLKDMIPILLGGFVLILNAERVEVAMFLKSKTNSTWIVVFVFSILNIILSILLMIQPFSFSLSLSVSILLLIIEIFYCIQNFCILFGYRPKKKKKEEKAIVEKEN